MKIVCDACHAKYSIADDKVQGKLFKTRCKKCSHVIVVRGLAAAEAPESTWHVVIGAEQVGPLTFADVAQRFAAGEIDATTFTWREGFVDWLPLGENAELSLVKCEPEPPAQKLRAERNATSVLFSLSDLSRIAAPRREPVTPTGDAAPQEGSGLIDIRSLASAYADAGITRAASSTGTIDDLPVFAASGFAEPMVIVPMSRALAFPRALHLMIAAMALLAAIAAVMIVLIVRDEPPAQRIAVAESADKPVDAPPVEPPLVVQAPPPPVEAVAPLPVEPAPSKPKKTRQQPAKAPRVTTPPPAPPAETCDAISCEINDYAGACCATYRKAAALPAAIDKPMISAGMAGVRARVMACGGKSAAKGVVTIKVYVASDGSVTKVDIVSAPETALGACVASAAKSASFASTQKGGSFRIPFTF